MNVTKVSSFSLVLAALFHESGRSPVLAGQSVAQVRVFTEFNNLSEDAQEGRLMTAMNLEQRIRFDGLAERDPSAIGPIAEHEKLVDRFARVIHDADREAIELGKVVNKVNPPRAWVPFDELPEVAQVGRRGQASYFLARFQVGFL